PISHESSIRTVYVRAGVGQGSVPSEEPKAFALKWGKATLPRMIQRDARAALGQDHRSGASELLAFAAAACRAALAETGPKPADFARALRQVCHAQPAMGAVFRLASRALEVATTAEHRGDAPEKAHDEIERAIEAFVTDFEEAGEAVVRQAHAVFPPSRWGATYSPSRLVETLFLHIARSRAPAPLLP